MDVNQLEETWGPRLLGILRIVTALIFMEHGAQKLLGFPPLPADRSMPEMFTLLWFAGFLELVGGFLVLIGFLTRPVAFILSGQMAVAYWMAHAPQAPYPALNGGDAAILFCFIFLYLAAAGAGAFSVDGARGRAAAA
jgi:putative oxidoreductase